MPTLPPLPMQFSAEIVRSDGDHGMVYVDGWMRRFETNFQTGQSKIVIWRPDKGLMWSLTPESKTYSQYKMPKAVEHLLDPDSLFDWSEDGEEMIDGLLCRRFIGRPHGEVGSVGDAHEICFVDARTQMRRRAVTFNKKGEQSLTVDYLNTILGPPPRTVFDLPEGYKRGYTKRRK